MSTHMGRLSLVSSLKPLTSCIKYHHLGIAVTSVEQSVEFFKLIGFQSSSASSHNITVLRNNGGLYVHLMKADKAIEDNKNLLMDYSTEKHPGHTHASFIVPSVPACREFFEKNGLVITGTRGQLAIFVRDPDRTTFEFERNDGQNEPPSDGFHPSHIGNSRPMDHLGIRIRAPYDDKLKWYADHLGFVHLRMKYEANPEPLKNSPPWITTTDTDCDINFIINCNTSAELPNILNAGGILRPGIVYGAFSVKNVKQAAADLRTAGVFVVADTDAEKVEWMRGISCIPMQDSFFIRDLDGSILRLVDEDQC